MVFSEFNGEIFIPNAYERLRAVYPGEGNETITAYPCIKDFRGVILIVIGSTDTVLILCWAHGL